MNHYDKILAENAMLKEENEALKAQLTASTRKTTQQLPRKQQTVTLAPVTPATWAQKVATNIPRRPVPSEGRIAAAARVFQTPSGPQGFEFLYLPRTRRMDRSDVRRRLRRLAIDTSRVMDIIFPSRTVVGLLVYSQYKPTVTSLLQEVKVELVPDFDPVDPKHIADPKHETLSNSERSRLAIQLHRDRLLRGLNFMRPHVAPAVAHAYVLAGWIDEGDVPQRPYTDRDDPSAAFRKEDDEMSEDHFQDL
ncbi:hypothetical protein Unana1_04058 [Umbelopsis nana]